MSPANRSDIHKAKRPSVRQASSKQASGRHPSAIQPNAVAGTAPMAEGQNADDQLLVTRRRFLYGAIGVGAVAAVGIGAAALGAGSNNAEVDTLKVPQSALSTLNDFTALDTAEGQVQITGTYEAPYGTIVWANDDDIATCLLPTESGSPLAQVGLLHLKSGNMETVLEEAAGKADGFEIYDVRGNSHGIVWTEANIMQGSWRIYVAPLTNGTLGAKRKVDEGDETYATPTLAVCGTQAFWQIIPRLADDTQNGSSLYAASFSSGDAQQIHASRRQSATPLYGTDDGIVIAPRSDDTGVYYKLTHIDGQTGEVTDTCTLPQGMKPLEAGYGQTGFMFSFSNIYDYGEGISNLGTYTPLAMPESSYSDEEWFGFARTPTAPPSWAGDLLIVKSSYSVCGVDLNAKTYFALDVENGADSYGEYLASTGTHNTFVTFTNIDHTPVGAEKIHACRIKVWTPFTAAERKLNAEQQMAERAAVEAAVEA